MKIFRFSTTITIAGTLLCAGVAAAEAPRKPVAHCAPIVIEGSVQRGQAFTAHLTAALDFKLEAVPAGWIVRILPRSGQKPPHDAAELANPPYLSPTPILISTDFAFRAQDAVAWNPRSFRFFTTPEQTAAAEAAWQAIQHEPTRPGAGEALYALLPQAAEGTLRIVDAEITGGTANQSAGAAAVATHFQQTAHSVRADRPPTPLGEILQLRFRATFSAARLLPGCR